MRKSWDFSAGPDFSKPPRHDLTVYICPMLWSDDKAQNDNLLGPHELNGDVKMAIAGSFQLRTENKKVEKSAVDMERSV